MPGVRGESMYPICSMGGIVARRTTIVVERDGIVISNECDTIVFRRVVYKNVVGKLLGTSGDMLFRDEGTSGVVVYRHIVEGVLNLMFWGEQRGFTCIVNGIFV